MMQSPVFAALAFMALRDSHGFIEQPCKHSRTIGHVFTRKRWLLLPILYCMALGAQAAVNADVGIDPAADLADELVGTVPANRVGSAEFLPDGRLFVLTQPGDLYLMPAGGGTAEKLFTVPELDQAPERGALDIVLDPDFETNDTFYIFHATPAGGTTARMRISAFELAPSAEVTLASVEVIWDSPGPPAVAAVHVGGSLTIGEDGKFYVSIGDNFEPANARLLDNVFGKIIRLNRDGSIPDDNPFVGRDDALGEVWAYGLRNPFRASHDPDTGAYIVGDVGGNVAATAREEIDVVNSGRDYGWPQCEGLTGCPPGTTLPVHVYNHSTDIGCCRNRAVVGGERYRAGIIPFIDGLYLYADFAQSSFHWVRFDNAYKALASGDFTIRDAPAVSFPSWMEVNPYDGLIYYVSFATEAYENDGQVRRIRYIGGNNNQPPVINQARASTLTTQPGSAVEFSALASDADGDAIRYAWDFGDGNQADSANVSHVYETTGRYQAVLTVMAGGATIRSAPIAISVGNPPQVEILTPEEGSQFVAGELVTLSATAFDAAGDALIREALSWDVRLFHGNHEHPFAMGQGETLELMIERTGHDFGDETGLLVDFKATDSNGLISTVSRRLLPVQHRVAVNSNLPGQSSFTFDSIDHELPYEQLSLEGFEHQMSIAESVCVGENLWAFDQWSSGADREHTLIVPTTDSCLNAIFVDQGARQQCGAADNDPASDGSVPTLPAPDCAVQPQNTDSSPGAGGDSNAPSGINEPGTASTTSGGGGQVSWLLLVVLFFWGGLMRRIRLASA